MDNKAEGSLWEIGKIIIAVVVLALLIFGFIFLFRGRGGDLLGMMRDLFKFGKPRIWMGLI